MKTSQNPGERINRMLAGDQTDRVAVWLWLLSPTFPAVNVGYSLYDIFSDPKKSFQAQIQTQELYRSDDIPRPSFGGDATLPFGGEIKLPTGQYEQTPTVTRYPVETEADAWDLKRPEDTKTIPPVPLYMTFAKYQEESGFPISIWCDSPFELARGLCGTENLCRWLIRKPKVVHHLLRIATDYGIRLVKYWADVFPAERIWVQTVTPTASNQMISPRQFETFSLPYEIERNNEILAMGIKHIFCHICGDQQMNLKYWAQVPMGNPGIVSFGHEVDIADAIRHLGDTCIIAGNIEPAAMLTGTPHQVYDLCRDVIEKGKRAPRGFILMPGCGISPKTPPYHAFMLIKAANDFGAYR